MRKINPTILSFLHLKALTVPACAADVASQFLGVSSENSPLIVDAFRETITDRPSGEPWCLDFVQTCIAYVETENNVTSPLAATEGVLDLWNKSNFYNAVKEPAVGDIILWRKGKTADGHCGLIAEIHDDHFVTVEGNTSNAEFVDRLGGEVCQKQRPKGDLKTFSLLGFLRPFSAA